MHKEFFILSENSGFFKFFFNAKRWMAQSTATLQEEQQ